MRVEIIESVKALAEFRGEWEAVYAADPEGQIYLSWMWMSKWLTVLPLPKAILAARPEGSSAYAAFFPLALHVKERDGGGFYNYINMGGNYCADYTGFICRPEFEEQAIPALAEGIKQLNWAELKLDYFCASDRRAGLFLQAFDASAFEIAETARIDRDNINHTVAPFAPLPGDWEAYLGGRLSANMRQKVRRLLRQIDSSGEFRVTHADAGTIAHDFEILIRFWTDQWGDRLGPHLAHALKQYRTMLRHAFDSGSLLLPVLWQGDRPVAALAILVDATKRAYHFFIAGRDKTFDGPQPGLTLHAHSIRHAIANGIGLYDFLRGDEPYKYSFGVEERRIQYIRVSTKDGTNLGGRLERRTVALALRKSGEHDRAGRIAQAERGYRQIIEVEPHNADALYGLAKIVAKRGEDAQAIGLFRTLLAARPDLPRAWFRLGRLLAGGGAFAEAAGAYCEGLEREPTLPGAYVELARALVELGQFDEAVAVLEGIRGLQPDHPDIDAGLERVLRVRAHSSPEESARRAAGCAEVRNRVGKLPAVAAAARFGRS
jgi:CelD/BcsL family acetyltransferase involved in cellulose biosynthesis